MGRPKKIKYEDQIEVINEEIRKRRHKWFLDSMPWIAFEDVEQIIRLHIYQKWDKWDQDISKVIQHTDIALIDGTFYSQGEIPHRDISEIPHPFITETMEHLYLLKKDHKNRVYFVHLNHSNPAIKEGAAILIIILPPQQ